SVEALRCHLALPGMVAAPGQVTDLVQDVGVVDGSGRDHGGLGFPGLVGSCGDLAALLPQDPADRLDRMTFGVHLVDEAGHHRLRGSSSLAKKVVAAFRIATSSRRRRFSAFNRLISASSSVVVPSRSPVSTWAWTTQRRTVSFPRPSCLATAAAAAVKDGYSA